MRYAAWTRKGAIGKTYVILMAAASSIALGSCSVNPATGEKQFTAFMPAGQEEAVGASEHSKVEQTYGKFMTGSIASYVQRVGAKVAANTERGDVQYKFSVIDSPIVNAFALPGGYIYISRGLLALANSEAELAAVLGHEIGHVTARHSAERMSQGVLVGLGAAVLSAAVGSSAVSQAANVGGDLYIKSYSRGQEHQADELGVRYLSRATYDPQAMASFLSNLDAQTKLDQQLAGQQPSEGGANYFSTHPLTSDRIVAASNVAKQYPQGTADSGHAAHLRAIDGMVYGDSPDQGFVKGTNFYHPKLGFTFSLPSGFKINNTPEQVVGTDNAGTIVLFDAAGDPNKSDPASYIRNVWLAGKEQGNVESVTVNGMRAATTAFTGAVNGKSATVRLMAIEWSPGQIFRFQIAIPQGASNATVEGLKKTTYSFRKLSESEKSSIRPARIQIVTASASDTQASLGARMSPGALQQERFRVLNGLKAGEPLKAGQLYKLVVE